MPHSPAVRPANAASCLDSGCSSVDGNTQGRGEEGRVEERRGAGPVLIGTEDRGQERKTEKGKRSGGETGSPRALRWLTLLNDASLS